MATIGEQLLAIKQIQLDLRTSIEGKGVVVGDAPFADYPSLVDAIVIGVPTGEETVYLGGEPVTLDGEIITIGA